MSTVRIIGNAPSIRDYKHGNFEGVTIALNMAPLYLNEIGVSNYVIWIQDWRLFIKREGLVSGDFDDVPLYAAHNIFVPSQFKKVERVFALGRHGFSLDSARGFYQGYNAAYGAMQLATRFSPSVIELWGIDLSYGFGGNRFYQDDVDWYLDLHAHARQLKNIAEAKRILKSELGVSVKFKTKSLVEDFYYNEDA